MVQHTASDARVGDGDALTEMDSARIADGVAVVYSARSPAKTTPNEDAAALFPFHERSGILAVADGVGGYRGGAQASQCVVASLRTGMQHAARDGTSLRAAILNGVETANEAVLSLGLGAATTLAAIEVHEHTVRPYHVGDSIVLVVGQRGKIKLQTVSHSPVGFAVEAGWLDEREALHHEERHLVSNVIGAADMRIEVGSRIPLAPRDTLLLASDGLFDNMHLDEIVESIRKGPLDDGIRRLATEARQRMDGPQAGLPSKPDDMTIIGYRRLPCAMSPWLKSRIHAQPTATRQSVVVESDPAA